MPPSALQPRHVYQYLGKRPAVTGNREKASLSAAMTQCVRWGAVDRNLVREVVRNEERPRDRYVTDAELASFLKHATPMIRAYVAIKMLTGLRQGQILGLQRDSWDGEKLTVDGAKGGRTVVYRGEGLADAVNALVSINRSFTASLYLLSSRKRTRYSSDGFRSIWQRCMKAHVSAGGERFTDHDLRAKVASDSGDVATASLRLGHQDTKTTNRIYRRKPAEVRVFEPGEGTS